VGLRKGAGRDSATPETAILVDLGADDLPRYVRALNLVPETPREPPWINVHRFLTRIEVGVPKLYAASIKDRLMLVEDAGESSLFSDARGAPQRASELYRRAVEELALIHVAGTRNPDGQCLAFSIAYEERLFLWEMNEFIEFGLPMLGWKGSSEPVSNELAKLSRYLGALPRVFSHRDYHGGNLFAQGNRVRVIDFQDALMAPAAHDLAVLLTTRDTAKVISPTLELELIDYYLDCVKRRGAERIEVSELALSYHRCVLQHAIKMIGRFIWLDQSKPGYIDFVSDCTAQARRMLSAEADFPILQTVFGIG
jgi:aminoglycoside/choline kinase family phosphotransferase